MIWIPADHPSEYIRRSDLKVIMKQVLEYKYVDDIFLDYECDLISYDSCTSLLNHYIYRKDKIEFIKHGTYNHKLRMADQERIKRIRLIKRASVRRAHSTTQAQEHLKWNTKPSLYERHRQEHNIHVLYKTNPNFDKKEAIFNMKRIWPNTWQRE